MTDDHRPFDAPESGFELHSALEKSHMLRQADRPQDARRVMLEALRSSPDVALLHAELADVHWDLKDYDEAAASAKTAISRDPECYWAIAILGRCAAEKGRHQQAEKHYLEALRVDPQFLGALLPYASLNFKVGEYDKAERLVLHALTIEPDDPTSHQLLSLIRTASENRSGAASAGAIGLELQPDHELSHLAIGLSHLQSGRPFSARRHLREALRIDPTDEDVREIYHDVDLASRWTYLPMYFYSLVVGKLPGSAFTVWGLVVVVLIGGPKIGIPAAIMNTIAITWVLFAIYTWLATPLTKLWMKAVPSK